MKKTFESHAEAMQNAEKISTEMGNDVYVLKFDSGGIRYVVTTETPKKGDKVLNFYQKGVSKKFKHG